MSLHGKLRATNSFRSLLPKREFLFCIEYRGLSVTGTHTEQRTAPHRRSIDLIGIYRFRLPRVMPHRPSSSDGRSLRFSYPQTLSGIAIARRMLRPSLRSPQPSYRRLRFGCTFLPSLTAEGRCGMDSTNPEETVRHRRITGSANAAIRQFRCGNRCCRIPLPNARTLSPTQKKAAPTCGHCIPFGHQACIRSHRSSRKRRIAPAWIWLTLPSDIPSRWPILAIVSPSKW